mmetsp:Transcript_132425/g.229695  ORF Transcript_132425/g.229695 Transcript_132425/m.229695 type:complete len:270 (+) Transcript_132425:446-1255(+)
MHAAGERDAAIQLGVGLNGPCWTDLLPEHVLRVCAGHAAPQGVRHAQGAINPIHLGQGKQVSERGKGRDVGRHCGVVRLGCEGPPWGAQVLIQPRQGPARPFLRGHTRPDGGGVGILSGDGVLCVGIHVDPQLLVPHVSVDGLRHPPPQLVPDQNLRFPSSRSQCISVLQGKDHKAVEVRGVANCELWHVPRTAIAGSHLHQPISCDQSNQPVHHLLHDGVEGTHEDLVAGVPVVQVDADNVPDGVLGESESLSEGLGGHPPLVILRRG